MTTVRVFELAEIKAAVQVKDAVDAVEAAFGKLAKNEVDVPFPMHIGVPETEEAGPGDCHIKGGYVHNSKTFTVKMASVGFTRNVALNQPVGGGLFTTFDAATGKPLAVFQEDRFMTDLRTGAAGAVALKYLSPASHTSVAFIGSGVIGKVLARGSFTVKNWTKAKVFDVFAENAQKFCDELAPECPGAEFSTAATVEEALKDADVVFTSTPGMAIVPMTKAMLKPTCTIICCGTDQPHKRELPADVFVGAKVITDITAQCMRIGDCRSAKADGVLDEPYAELGEVVNGTKEGRTDADGVIIVDLTGTGAQDAAIGQVAWDILSKQ